MAKKTTTTIKEIKKEISAAKKRIGIIEKHTGAKIELNIDTILSHKNKDEALSSLKNISWNKLKAGKGFRNDFIEIEVQGEYWTKAKGWTKTKTIVPTNQGVSLLKSVAKRERITGEVKKISIAGVENIPLAKKYFNYFKTKEQFKRHEARNARKRMNNFSDNLGDMLEFVEDKHKRAEIRRLRQLIKSDPLKFDLMIREEKLYDLAGVNFYESKDQKVELKENWEKILEILRSKLGVSDLTDIEAPKKKKKK